MSAAPASQAAPLGTLVIGAGGRVRDAVLPALARLGPAAELHGVFARKTRELEVEGRSHPVRPLGSLTAEEVRAARLVYVVVAKPAVGAVLRELKRFDVAHLDLLLETPVVLFKHLGDLRETRAFRRVSVAEDLSALPWLDLVRRLTAADGPLGAPRHLVLDRAGYAYHGVALSKALLEAERVARGTRRRRGANEVRRLHLTGGRTVEWISPRDYAAGHFELQCERGRLSDRPAANATWIAPLCERDRQVGVRAGDLEQRFDDEEAALVRTEGDTASLTARMQDMKRIGLLRLFRRLAAGEPAYPLSSGLDDMLVDYHLEKLGAYVANPLTSARGALRPLVEGALRVVTRGR